MTAREDALDAIETTLGAAANLADLPAERLAVLALGALDNDVLLALALERHVITERAALTDNNAPRRHHRFFVQTEMM